MEKPSESLFDPQLSLEEQLSSSDDVLMKLSSEMESDFSRYTPPFATSY
jgi:hypothetical protein